MTYCTGCRNVSHCQQQQSYTGLRSPGRSNSTYFWNDSWVQNLSHWLYDFQFFWPLTKRFILSALSHVPLGFCGLSKPLAIKRCLYCRAKLGIVWDPWDLVNCLQHSDVINVISGVSRGGAWKAKKNFFKTAPPFSQVLGDRAPPNLKVWTCHWLWSISCL